MEPLAKDIILSFNFELCVIHKIIKREILKNRFNLFELHGLIIGDILPQAI